MTLIIFCYQITTNNNKLVYTNINKETVLCEDLQRVSIKIESIQKHTNAPYL